MEAKTFEWVQRMRINEIIFMIGYRSIAQICNKATKHKSTSKWKNKSKTKYDIENKYDPFNAKYSIYFLETKYDDTFKAKYSIADSRTKSYNNKFKLIKNVVDAKKRVSIFRTSYTRSTTVLKSYPCCVLLYTWLYYNAII